jgi:hypothetical protein
MQSEANSRVLLSRQPLDRVPAGVKPGKINNKFRKTKVDYGPY